MRSVSRCESDLARRLGDCLRARQWSCAVAESCTGGLLAALITSVSGSSQWFDRGFITYSNQAKRDMLHVPDEMLQKEGAVSEAVARTMAEGALLASTADITVAITGIAGPDGGSIEKPVGLVCFAWSVRDRGTDALVRHFKGDRACVRSSAIAVAMKGLISRSCLKA